MLNDENAPIRYLMKEMDPSEELLMERAMMEDDDLLIEVESLRQTLKRLDKLPKEDPSAHITESVINYAAQKAEERHSSNMFSFQPIRYAAAAVVLLSVSIGGFMVYQEMGNSNTGISTNVNSNMEASQTGTEVGEMGIPSLNVSTYKDNRAEPWIDNKEMIYFQDRFNSSSAEFDSILKNSMQKLTPLSSPTFYNPGTRSIQMTSTGIRQ